jgi:PAS domain S-box-containing protein
VKSLTQGSTLKPAAMATSGLLRDQLYLYAGELQTLMQSHGELEQRFRTLSELHRSAIEGHSSLEGFIQLSQDIYLLTDCAGMISQCNPAAAAIAPLAQVPGTYIGDLIVPAHLETLRNAMDALLMGDADATSSIELHFKSCLKAEGLRITAATLLPARQNGVLQGIHWIIRDLTPQREAEFETQITSLVLDNATEGVVIADVAGHILAVNPAFTNITGYTADEVIGRSTVFLQADITEGPFYADLWRALPLKGQWRGQISNRKKNGERFTAWQTLTSARDSEGKVLSYICVLSDLSRVLDAEPNCLTARFCRIACNN